MVVISATHVRLTYLVLYFEQNKVQQNNIESGYQINKCVYYKLAVHVLKNKTGWLLDN